MEKGKKREDEELKSVKERGRKKNPRQKKESMKRNERETEKVGRKSPEARG